LSKNRESQPLLKILIELSPIPLFSNDRYSNFYPAVNGYKEDYISESLRYRVFDISDTKKQLLL
jgi:hypothetical protein